jgi:hypothetical protein
LVLAYLRDGERGVCEALLGAAIVHGVLIADLRHPLGGSAPEFRVSSPLERRGPLSEPLAVFYARIRCSRNLSSAALRHEVKRAASGFLPVWRTRLQDSGFLHRTDRYATPVAWCAVCTAFVVLTLASSLLPASHRAASIVIMLAAALLTGAYVHHALQHRPTAAGKDYLAWIRALTCSLRAEVRESRRVSVGDVVLTISIGGLAEVANARLFAHSWKVVEAVLRPPEDNSCGCGCG